MGHQPHVTIIHHFHPSATNFGVLAENLYQKGAFEDVVYFEPYYLKQFVAGKPRVKGLE